jgi:hypothetical protein
MISSLASKWQVLKVMMPAFQPFNNMKLKTLSLKSWHFEASEDMTKFKSQSLHIIGILLIKRPPVPNILTASVTAPVRRFFKAFQNSLGASLQYKNTLRLKNNKLQNESSHVPYNHQSSE